ncbi:acyl-CoA thioesterase [Gordonia hirsuta DSM 44140 = NBRC 16056]|uniref:Acyl-CoA thioesterase 2 n=1 Tax=Gordonia hirsuta DSM 44140 = NBRC 16056 TaxID=1121927 RepID=L7L891_9ACTN|nr:acyl-CoA thioesterase II [Gordonia hirsuta]GAC57365.1 acyl-CoA thioesterase [Gordonia hirsuta DSM 44140 = NBRC 16056]
MPSIEEILAVERIDDDIYRGGVFPSALRRTFGGQVAGQALISATKTVDPGFGVHSLHGYFLRPGKPDQPAVYLVDRIRDGRSFVTRRVTGVQNGEAIFSMSASFHISGDEGIDHQDLMPRAVDPETLVDRAAEGPNRDLFKEWETFDIRIVPRDQLVTRDGLAAQQRVWFRYRDRLPDDQLLHVCTLAYMSDMTLLGSSKVPHPGVQAQTASLDHAMWFLRPFRTDDWLLYDQTSPSAGGGRALTQGRIFDRAGRMVAAVTQEGLTRTNVPADQISIMKGPR